MKTEFKRSELLKPAIFYIRKNLECFKDINKSVEVRLQSKLYSYYVVGYMYLMDIINADKYRLLDDIITRLFVL